MALEALVRLYNHKMREWLALERKMGYRIGKEDPGIDNVLTVNSHVFIIFLCFIINIY